MEFIFFWISLFSLGFVKGSGPPTGWIHFDPDPYYFQIFEMNMSFWAANKYCQNYFNSNLVTITSNANFNQLDHELLSKNISEAWIGLTDFGHEGRYTWISNYQPVIITNWEKSYPRDFRNAADCVIAKRNSSDKYTWMDRHCSENHSFVCMWMDTAVTPNNKFLPHQSHYTNQCPKPFFPVDGDCFWISHEKLTWEQGRKECKSKHEESDLATIRTNFQQEYFAALLSGNFTAFWIGLNFNVQFQWILQQDITLTKWGENEPNSQKKPCVYMSGNEHQLGEWFSAACSKNLKAICQTLKKLNSSQQNDNPTLESDLNYDGILFQKMGCEKPGYIYYHGACYRLLSESPVTHEKASKLCESDSFTNKTGHKFQPVLVHFENSGEKYFILSNWRRLVSDLPTSSMWLGINGSKSENETILRIKLSNNSQVPGFEYSPNSMKTLKNMCFKLLLNGIVNVSNCGETSTAITMCKYRLNNFNSKDLDSNKLKALCPKNWKLHNSVCFYFDSTIYPSQYAARKECMKLGSYLPSIDMQQQKFIQKFISTEITKGINHKSFNAWIGLEIFKKSERNIQYKWNNEAPIRYINLKMSQFIHKEQGKKKWCTLFSADNGLWEVVNCTYTQATLICQKDAEILKIEVPEIKPSTTSTIVTSTKANIIEIVSEPGYKIQYEQVAWDEALRICKSLKVSRGFTSNLAVFKQFSDISQLHLSNYEQNIMVESKFWIGLSGLYDHFDNAFIRWSDNFPLVFQNFEYKNLMNLTGNENCVAIDLRTSKWFAVNCDEKIPFICQISQKNASSDIEKPSRNIYDNLGWANPRRCPKSFVEHSNKCYHVVEDRILDWQSADKYCHEMIPKDYRNTAYLVSIESTFDNSFVYSLLSRNIYSNNDTRYWIGERYKSHRGTKPICTAISGHPDPYIGARWFTVDCSTRLKFICSTMKIPGIDKIKSNKKCESGFVEYENAIGTSCYHFNPHINNLQEAEHRCNLEKPKSHLLSIQSHYHMHFLRSQMEVNGFSRDRPLWLGAEIESHQRLYNWQWYNGQNIRYTIWNKQPIFDTHSSLSNDLCFYFIPEKDVNNKLGMQIELCDLLKDKKYGICEYIVDNYKDLEFVDKESNINCLRDINGDSYEGQTNITADRRRCVRWDLLKPSPLLSKLINSIRNDANKHKFMQYQSNECRYIKDMGRQTTFCAVDNDITSENPPLEECIVQLCRNISKTLHHEVEVLEHHSNTLVVVFVTLVLFLCIIVCIAMLSWRRWNKGALFGGYLRRSQFSFLNSQSRGTSFNNPVYRPINT